MSSSNPEIRAMEAKKAGFQNKEKEVQGHIKSVESQIEHLEQEITRHRAELLNLQVEEKRDEASILQMESAIRTKQAEIDALAKVKK